MKGTGLTVLFGGALYCLTPFSVHTANPATKEYVDSKINQLHSQVVSIYAVPTGGTTGQVLAKASSANYDTHWVSSSTNQYMVGQSVLGGVIFYIYVDSLGIQHGLVAATTDEPGGAIYTWGASTTPGTAQYQCASVSYGGYTDWVVPNQAQITALYNNRFAIDPTAPNGNGGFSNNAVDYQYWSSTVDVSTPGNAWMQIFAGGGQVSGSQIVPSGSVRCIRVL